MSTSDAPGRIVVVGGSLAGLRAAEELRHRGFAGTITVVGDERHQPYDRPPLSKQVLAGDWGVERTDLTVMHPDGVAGLDLDWRLGTRATGLDVAGRRVLLGDGTDVGYDGLVIATKGGSIRFGPEGWGADGRPEHLREACEGSLRRLHLDRIDLYQLHTVDPHVPLEESVGALKDLQEEGKIRHLGLSNVDLDELDRSLEIADVASVQNRYSLEDRGSEDVLRRCAERGIGFIPWFPLAAGRLTGDGRPLTEVARAHRATPAQIALAWLLARSSVMLPIPGTSKVEHLEENVAAATIQLADEEIELLSRAVG